MLEDRNIHSQGHVVPLYNRGLGWMCGANGRRAKNDWNWHCAGPQRSSGQMNTALPASAMGTRDVFYQGA